MHMNHVTGKNMRDCWCATPTASPACIPTKATCIRRSARSSPRTRPSTTAAKEYARGDVTTNTVEGFFGIFKRGMAGVYQHCGEQHLQRYLDEFTFRYNNRASSASRPERAVLATQGMDGSSSDLSVD